MQIYTAIHAWKNNQQKTNETETTFLAEINNNYNNNEWDNGSTSKWLSVINKQHTTIPEDCTKFTRHLSSVEVTSR